MNEWETLVRKWWDRLIPDGEWQLFFGFDTAISGDAEVHIAPQSRRATFGFAPCVRPSDLTACHEVVHVLVNRYPATVGAYLEQIGDPDAFAKNALENAMEEMVADLTRAFLRAYGGDDDG